MSRIPFIILFSKDVLTFFHHHFCYPIDHQVLPFFLLNKFQIHTIFSVPTGDLLIQSTIISLLGYRKILLNGLLVHSNPFSPLQSVIG